MNLLYIHKEIKKFIIFKKPIEFFDRPIFSPLGSGWEVQFITSFSQPGVVVWETHAICFDNPPLRP